MSPSPSASRSPGMDREKHRVALVSVLAALLLTGSKVAVGLWTGSLGILAEAMHSGVDLAAALITLWAVRWSGRPADAEHAYGHGKIENLSALFETALLLVTCVWIMKEGIERLFFRAEVHIDANVWSFLVVVLSIAVDYSRSRALLRVARKYQSQALEADALHFSTDIWSSLVVLVGLFGVLAAHTFAIPWLAQADAVAALGVALVVVLVSLKLGRRAVGDLLDAVPSEIPTHIATLARVDGVSEVRDVRVRRSGPELFVDLALVVDGGESLERGHAIACQSEAAIKQELPSADIVVHVEPATTPAEDVLTTARRIANAHGAAAHNLLVYQEAERRVLELHLEMAGSLPLGKAHRSVTEIDQEIRRAHPALSRVITHIEPAGGTRASTSPGAEDAAKLREAVLGLPELQDGRLVPDSIDIRRHGSELALAFRCTLPAATSVEQAHDFTMRVEQALRRRVPGLGRLMVQTEPAQEP